MVQCRSYACPLTISLGELCHGSFAAKSLIKPHGWGTEERIKPKICGEGRGRKERSRTTQKGILWKFIRISVAAKALERCKSSKRDYNGKWAVGRILENINI